MVEVSFASRVLRSICEVERYAADAIGEDASRLLRARLADLRAASFPLEIPAGNPRIVIRDEHPLLIVDLAPGFCAVFCANHPRNPTTKTGETDWARVTRVKLNVIEGPNGQAW